MNRYYPLSRLEKELFDVGKYPISILGYSVLKRPIYKIIMGHGDYKILLWSQMHGNESTTTRALVDILKRWSFSDEGKSALKRISLHIIPMLNPDGAQLYKRENAKGIDLNRDFLQLTQPESNLLYQYFHNIKPDVCLNLHDQRSIYGLKSQDLSASISFLAPSADENKSITPARIRAMELIGYMGDGLRIPEGSGMGRFDDTYNPNCVGDTFQKKGTPTILVEAGHANSDYGRNISFKIVSSALTQLFAGLASGRDAPEGDSFYWSLPENQPNFYDMRLKNLHYITSSGTSLLSDIGLRFEERLINKRVLFYPILDPNTENSEFLAHNFIDFYNYSKDYPFTSTQNSYTGLLHYLRKYNVFEDWYINL